ncbi:metal-dependent hydrolase [Oceanobacillus sp. CF4.6]|uniref:metal-dependent hydrolase n=1 Tax=Oceanobacillus sp. CF4.6 TaxID=3373080 RepID=UPI003EE77962
MEGTTHALIGATTGLMTASIYQTDLASMSLLVAIGTVSGLVPDLDIDGKLSNRITFSKKFLQIVSRSIAIFIIAYSLFTGIGMEKWIGVGAGISIIIISSLIRQRRMLTITGIGVLVGGQALEENWIWLLGIYIIIASFVSHRSYTHSILGIIFFGVIASSLEKSLVLDGVFVTCILGYISHLFADMKVFPVNKRGIKLFLPFSRKQF